MWGGKTTTPFGAHIKGFSVIRLFCKLIAALRSDRGTTQVHIAGVFDSLDIRKTFDYAHYTYIRLLHIKPIYTMMIMIRVDPAVKGRNLGVAARARRGPERRWS